ncbi:GGDEF domain-containing protein [Gimesia maris]|uniref:GGDEF domain-containing protein n=1 Tax=Gimesia maris TaxID=122 RepID=UPI00241E0381|nr:diguanylate cyclase [Gimesia maris]|tara:strand:- start:251008 stop:251943 length:936 start_codon:yes stop_codon:yes gene_type:complete
MTPALATILSTLPNEILICFGAGLLIAASLGFAAGYALGKSTPVRNLRRAQKHLQNCYQHVKETLDTACTACSLLEKFPGTILTSDQTRELNSKRTSLLSLINRLVERKNTEPEKTPPVTKQEKKKPQDFPALQWAFQPEHSHLKLPDSSAFEANLEMLLLAGTSTENNSGLLLVQMNQHDQLKERFGIMAPIKFMKTLSRLIMHNVRDEDVICLWKSDTLAILFPGVEVDAGQICAETIRDAIRHHHFRLESNSPEVVVTASLAYLNCVPGDSAELVLERGLHALAQSQKQGRNQLIIQDSHSYEHKQAV